MGRLLVGRARELAALSAAAQTAGETGKLVLLSGEAGIGKSRLADELARVSARDGREVAWGRAWEASAAPPFWPWIQVARALGAPDMADLFEAGSRSGADRFDVFDAFARELAALAARRRLVVILEDLHAADQPTLLLLAFVAQQIRSMPLLLCGTFREVEARLDRERGPLLARIGREADHLPLGRLTRGEVAHLVVDAVGVADDALIDAVHQTSDGNPLFVDEILRLVETRGSLPGAIPDGVRAVIREHVARVTAHCRSALAAAAVLGRDVALAPLAALAARDLTAVAEDLAEATRAGLLIESGLRQWRFSHVLVRDTLYDDLSSAQRTDLHRRAAEILSGAALLDPTDPTAPVAEVARHYAEGGPECAERAIDAALGASRAARARLAPEEAVPLLERALQILADHARGDEVRRGDLLVELAETAFLAGLADLGRQVCRQAIAIARAIGSSELEARAALARGMLFTFGSVDPDLVATLEGALSALPPAPSDLRARLLARLAGALQPARDPTVPIARAREAIAVARDLGEATLLPVLVGAGSALQDIADPSERLPLNEELLRLAIARGDRVLALRARARLAFDHLEAADPAAGDAQVRAYDRMAEELGRPRHRFFSAMWWGMRALMKGRLEEHARHLDEARRIGVDDNALRCLACHAFLAARMIGDLDAAARLAPDARWFLDALPASIAFVEALLHCDAGRLEEARAALGRVTAQEHVAAVPTIMRSLQAEAIAAAGDGALSRSVAEALAPFAHRLGAWSQTAMFCDGPVARHLALVASTSGDWPEAERRWEEAEALARADDMRAIVVHITLERAEALARRGRPEDGALVARLADAARGDAETLGMPLLAARAQRIGRASSGTTAEAVTMRREGETWTIEGAGEVCRVKDSRGARMLARLVEMAGQEVHALDLAGAGPEDGAVDLGDSGELLDQQAKASYRARLLEVKKEIAQAEEWNDLPRLARARAEEEALVAELSRAVGLGGRDRRAGAAAERARVNANRRLTDVIRRVGRTAPQLATHLEASVRTGTYCSYQPDRA